MKKLLIILLLALYGFTGRLISQDKDTITTLPTFTVSPDTVVSKEVNKAFKKSFSKAQNLK
jgi:hypothetical protein